MSVLPDHAASRGRKPGPPLRARHRGRARTLSDQGGHRRAGRREPEDRGQPCLHIRAEPVLLPGEAQERLTGCAGSDPGTPRRPCAVPSSGACGIGRRLGGLGGGEILLQIDNSLLDGGTHGFADRRLQIHQFLAELLQHQLLFAERALDRKIVRPLTFDGTHGALSSATDFPWDAPGRYPPAPAPSTRSAEHTSELQSLMSISYDVLCLKKQKHKIHTTLYNTISHTKHDIQ